MALNAVKTRSEKTKAEKTRTEKVAVARARATESVSAPTAGSSPENPWYILRGEMRFGPFDFSSMVRMIQCNELFDYNYVWSNHLDNWTLLSDLGEFSRDRMNLLIQDPQFSASFNRRINVRKAIDTPVIAHNRKYLFDGRLLNISAGGGLFLLNDPLLVPDDDIMILISDSNVVPKSFKVIGKVIRKNFTKQRLNVKSGINYAIRFLQVQEHGKGWIHNYIQSSK